MSSSKEILVVDDEPLNRELLRRLLGRSYSLHEAGDGNEALEIMERETISLIISDYLMPGMNGIELATQIRERWPSAVFLLLTGYDDNKEIVEAKQHGEVHAVIGKPWRTSELRAAIASYLDE